MSVGHHCYHASGAATSLIAGIAGPSTAYHPLLGIYVEATWNSVTALSRAQGQRR